MSEETRTIAFVLYPGVTALDLIGPLQVLTSVAQLRPEYRAVVVAAESSVTTTDTPIRMAPSHTFDDVAEPYALVVPGGLDGTFRALSDERLLGYLRRAGAGASVVASVCTGSLLLAEAGLLAGRRATTHWSMLDLLGRLGARPVEQRWVEDGRYITAAGVSAGIDMALALAVRLIGEDAAREVQFVLEYDPLPPLGPLDWSRAPRGMAEALRRVALDESLAGQDELRARLTG